MRNFYNFVFQLVKIFRAFGKWPGTGEKAPMTLCVTTRVVKEISDHRGRQPSRNWRNIKTFRGKHHQVARALEAVNHQQHDHDWRTTSRRKTTSGKESCWWVSRCKEIYVAREVESDISNMCAVIAWIWIVNVYCHDRFFGHMACPYCPDFPSFIVVVVNVRLIWLVCSTDVAFCFF